MYPEIILIKSGVTASLLLHDTGDRRTKGWLHAVLSQTQPMKITVRKYGKQPYGTSGLARHTLLLEIPA